MTDIEVLRYEQYWKARRMRLAGATRKRRTAELLHVHREKEDTLPYDFPSFFGGRLHRDEGWV
jgi:hypothetical protein